MEKKNKKIKLFALQTASIIGNRDKNINIVRKFLDKYMSKESADFVFLPEVWTAGWDCPSFHSCAEEIKNSKSIAMLKDIAQQYKTNIIGGSIILKNGANYYNSCPVINKKGELVCTYDKNHLFSYYGCDEGKFIKAGENPVIVELDGVKIGISICYDIRFPELYRAYRKAGADILVNMAAWGASKKIPWDSMTTSRAVENQTYFVALTQTGILKNGEKNLGHSMILDYKGDILSEINKKEGGIYAEIDLDEMYNFRDKCRVLDDIKKSYEVIIK